MFFKTEDSVTQSIRERTQTQNEQGVIFIDNNRLGTRRKVRHEDNTNSRTGHTTGEEVGKGDAEIRPA